MTFDRWFNDHPANENMILFVFSAGFLVAGYFTLMWMCMLPFN